ncbi:AbrB family transcriptional regulator [Candidatus Nitrosotenuis cloacae]|jgi:AbrB family looped-hinge helix DNA binding protein|uniref:AbrB family transcriptional regulator n=2 Tax=Candidatus Nitrosotenuis cloacae TaxID=1603555 RepID=A0A3G1B2D6_9ARCH|nr:AbrB family transcriptional regulator [Candidatus Nitrosotenuis cloacae]
MMLTANDDLVKITAVGTISIPKQFRKYLGIQKGDYVKVSLQGDSLILKRVTIS